MENRATQRKLCFPITGKVKEKLKLNGEWFTTLKEISETTKTNAERIRMSYKLLYDHNLLPAKSLMKCQKDEKKALEARKHGNQHFANNKFRRALEWYNESLCFAPLGSESMAIGYANRSAIYFKAGFYKFCMENIELALENPYPEKLKPKLMERREKCEALMKTEKDATEIYGHVQGPELSYPENPKIPGLADVFEYVEGYVKDEQNYLDSPIVAKVDLTPGDIVFVGKPFSLAVLQEHLYSNCYNCMSPNFLNLKPCNKSTIVMFCSDKCATEAWDKFYKFECPIVDGLCDIFEKVPLHAIRCTLKAFTLFKNPRELKTFVDQIEAAEKNPNPLDVDLSTLDGKSKFKALYLLETKQECRRASDYLEYTLTMALAWYMLKKYTEMHEVLEDRRIEDLFLELLMRFLQITNHNIFGTSFEHQFEKNGDILLKEHSSALHPVHSIFPHSCASNLVDLNGGYHPVIAVNRPIKAGGLVFGSHGMHHFRHSIQERQNWLEEKYSLQCFCEACVDNFPYYNKAKAKFGLPKELLLKMKSIEGNYDFDDDIRETARKGIPVFGGVLKKVEEFYPSLEIYYLQESMGQCFEIAFSKKPLDLIFSSSKN